MFGPPGTGQRLGAAIHVANHDNAAKYTRHVDGPPFLAADLHGTNLDRADHHAAHLCRRNIHSKDNFGATIHGANGHYAVLHESDVNGGAFVGSKL